MFESLPKVELHLHLDISLGYDVVARLAPSVTRAQFDTEFVAPPKCLNLADYLARTRASVALLQTEAALRLATEDLCQRLAADHVVYAELRFAPLLHTEDGLTPLRVVEIVEQAADHASAATGVETRLILCTLRHFTAEQSLRTAYLVTQFQGSRVAALDLAGDEAGFPLQPHIPAFEYAAEHEIPLTAHAGEASGPESVWETLAHLRPARLGHGVRSIEDAALVAHLKAEGIHLEVCPACNVQIDIFNAYANHPIDQLYRAGVSVGINTDSRGVTPTTLTQDYGRLADVFGWGKAEFLQCNLNAAAAAFAPEDIKARLVGRLHEGYGM